MNDLWEAVDFKEESINSRFVKVFSNLECGFVEKNKKGKRIRTFWLNLCDVNAIDSMKIEKLMNSEQFKFCSEFEI